MKIYVTPEMDIQTVAIADIITLSLLGFKGLGGGENGIFDADKDNNSGMDI